MRQRVGIPVLALVAVLVLVAGACSPKPMPSESGAGSGDTASVDADADKAPDFSLNDIHGASVRLSEAAGKVTLVDFWATWCAPCREEIPMLKRLHETYGEQGLTILAISDEEAGSIKEFVESHEIPYANLIDAGSDVSMQYSILGLPTALLIDSEGTIVNRYFGPKSAKVLEGRIRELLELPPAT